MKPSQFLWYINLRSCSNTLHTHTDENKGFFMELGRGKPHQNPSSSVGWFLGSTLGTQRIPAILPRLCGPANNSNKSREGREAWLWPTSQNRPYISYTYLQKPCLYTVVMFTQRLFADTANHRPSIIWTWIGHYEKHLLPLPVVKSTVHSSVVNSRCLLTGWL